MFNTVVFSKDRAAQLDLFLVSFKKMCNIRMDMKVLYTYSSDEFKNGYDLVQNYHPDILFIKEDGFKNSLLLNIFPNRPYTIFFVDDDIFKEPFSVELEEFKKFQNREDIATLSLRMCPRLNFCYTRNISSPAPDFIEPCLWSWRLASVEWAYPMSLDGHFFKTTDIFPLLYELNYRNPNNLEDLLASYPINKPYMLCFQESKIVNIPVNKVQTHNGNRCGNISVSWLNKNFLSGQRLRNDIVVGFKNISPHQEIDLVFEKFK